MLKKHSAVDRRLALTVDKYGNFRTNKSEVHLRVRQPYPSQRRTHAANKQLILCPIPASNT